MLGHAIADNLKIHFQGRLGRKNYLDLLIFWNCLLLISWVVVEVAFNWLDYAGLFRSDFYRIAYLVIEPNLYNILIFTIVGGLFFYLVAHMCAISVRRLHDMNKSGGWIFPAFITVLITFFMAVHAFGGYSATALYWFIRLVSKNPLGAFAFIWGYIPIFILAVLSCFLVCLFLPAGMSSPNRFGYAPPKGGKLASEIIRTCVIFFIFCVAVVVALIVVFFIALGNGQPIHG